MIKIRYTWSEFPSFFFCGGGGGGVVGGGGGGGGWEFKGPSTKGSTLKGIDLFPQDT